MTVCRLFADVCVSDYTIYYNCTNEIHLIGRFLYCFDIRSMTGRETASTIYAAIRLYHLELDHCIGTMHDRASVNGVAMEEFTHVLKISGNDYRQDGPCWSHTIDNAGGKFVSVLTDAFMSQWNVFFKNSNAAKALFQDYVFRSVASISETRWWSEWEQQVQVIQHLDEIRLMLNVAIADTELPRTIRSNASLLKLGLNNGDLILELAGILI